MELKLKEKYGLFIDGKWQDSSDGKTFSSENPATGEHIAYFQEATKEDVDKAVDAAWRAFPKWKNISYQEKASILNKIADVIEENQEMLSIAETIDNGKPIRETKYIDIPWSIEHFRYFAGAILTQEGKSAILNTPNFKGEALSIVLKEPIGVVGQIIPWNFPFLMAAWKIAPAIAAGDCIVLKTSSSTPLSVMLLMELIQDIVPKGVINVITGKGSKSGQYMLDHPGFKKLAFTGSTEVGLSVAKKAAEKLIPSTLELGGKSANIIFDDCDIEQALDGLQVGILFNQGQVCCAGSRIFVQEGIYDEFIDRAKKAFDTVKQGDPLSMDTKIGASINLRQVEKVGKYIDIAREEGASVISGGERNTDGDLKKGCFFKPTLITDVTNDMRVAREEIFGPVAVVIKFKTEEEVIKMANDSDYGLGGAVWTKNINKAIRVARSVETGRMWVNTYNQIPAGAPFGGYKKSGIGRETDLSILDAYTQTKNIFINLSDETSGFFS